MRRKGYSKEYKAQVASAAITGRKTEEADQEGSLTAFLPDDAYLLLEISRGRGHATPGGLQ